MWWLCAAGSDSRAALAVALGLNKDKPKETTLEIYQQCFEDDFIAATELYYTSESSQFIEANSVADYMKKVEMRLEEEVKRVRAYLHQSSEADLISKCDRVLIEKHVETVWNEFQNLLQDDKLEGEYRRRRKGSGACLRPTQT